jgi:hypothetical protein
VRIGGRIHRGVVVLAAACAAPVKQSGEGRKAEAGPDQTIGGSGPTSRPTDGEAASTARPAPDNGGSGLRALPGRMVINEFELVSLNWVS